MEAKRAQETTPIDICKEQLNQFVSTDVHSEFYFGNVMAEQHGISNQALTLFWLEDLYTDGKIKMGDYERLIMSQSDLNIRTKMALKLISVNHELHRCRQDAVDPTASAGVSNLAPDFENFSKSHIHTSWSSF